VVLIGAVNSAEIGPFIRVPIGGTSNHWGTRPPLFVEDELFNKTTEFSSNEAVLST
jgi:hypothetical protein